MRRSGARDARFEPDVERARVAIGGTVAARSGAGLACEMACHIDTWIAAA